MFCNGMGRTQHEQEQLYTRYSPLQIFNVQLQKKKIFNVLEKMFFLDLISHFDILLMINCKFQK